ncbi:DUF6879 family protein [Streptomyces sp. NBC_00370]|uniref:DUF6879 family protein n=1 Tax=Streptomyces sp. NBC_00370 TaxID=2975728 RepID=UPI002E26A005|nr:DUF6879 family protein [Streptomyces sp. NBC_00370]
MPSSRQTFDELIANCTRSAVHLEMRDTYGVDYESGPFAQWRGGFRHDPADRASWWRPWLSLVEEAVARGIVIRRARIVSEPVSDYTRFLYDGTFTNVAAGELVRWLPRRRASDIPLPGNDFWLFDDDVVLFNHFTGEGASAGPEVEHRGDVVKLCSAAFETVWERGIPHDEYKPQ